MVISIVFGLRKEKGIRQTAISNIWLIKWWRKIEIGTLCMSHA
jgi:hypothetical protein